MGKRGGGFIERFIYQAFLGPFGHGMADLSRRFVGIFWVAQKGTEVTWEQ